MNILKIDGNTERFMLGYHVIFELLEHLKTFTNVVGRVEHEITTLLVHVQTNMYLCKLYGT